jgi:two-component system response regulator MprA
MTRVLIVDDDPALREMLAIILTSEGYEVERARDGMEAVACLARGWRPAVMLLDVMMPVMDGVAVCEWVAARLPAHERPRIVILSASIAPGVTIPLADAQLSKPFGVDAVLEIVQRFCVTLPNLHIPLPPVLPMTA